MERIEDRLKSVKLSAPSDALRTRVLKAAERERPSEWKRLQHTLEWCAASLIAVYGWAIWFESGSEEIRQGLRTTTYAETQARVEREVALALSDAAEPPVRDFIVAQSMAAYARPFVVQTEEIVSAQVEMY